MNSAASITLIFSAMLSSYGDFDEVCQISDFPYSVQLAKKYHPDANKNSPSAKRKFQEIRDAYEVCICLMQLTFCTCVMPLAYSSFEVLIISTYNRNSDNDAQVNRI